jgi:uracil-DNA glycosylase
MFTGDRSGDFLYAALHRAGLASQPESTSRDDGLILEGAYITAAVRCAPPANKPTTEERDNCREYLENEFDIMLPQARVLLALGKYAFDQVLRVLRGRGVATPSPAPKFGHGVDIELESGLRLIAAFHPSQQNTFTGKLTPAMFDAVLAQAKKRALDAEGYGNQEANRG